MPKLVFNGKEFDIRRKKDNGFWSASDLRKASGRTDTASKFSNWERTKSAKDLGSHICDSKKIPEVFQQLGGKAGTWVLDLYALAYCEFLSTEFHAVVLETFKAAAQGDGEKAVKKAKKVASIERQIAIENRKILVGEMYKPIMSQDLHPQKVYSKTTNRLYEGLWGKNAAELRTEKGLKEKANVRDYMDDVELTEVFAAEFFMAVKFKRGGIDPTSQAMQDLAYNAGRAVRRL